MTDRPDDPPESPMQRALRMRKAALAANKAPGGAAVPRKPAAGIAAGASRPWMKK